MSRRTEVTRGARENLQEAPRGLAPGYCDTCGARIPESRKNGRGEARYCSDACRDEMRRIELTFGRRLFRLVRDERVFKHCDPARSNAARSISANIMAEYIWQIEADRLARRQGGEDVMTIAEIKKVSAESG